MSDDDAPSAFKLCLSCERWVALDRIALHLDGLDGAHSECPCQELYEIVKRARGAERVRPWTPTRRRALW